MEWKERCALALCCRETGGALSAFAARRLGRFLDRLRSSRDRGEPAPATDAWHLFETHLLLKRSRKGIQYKDWLFARLEGSKDDPLDVIQGGATLILRDVAREMWRAEGSRRRTDSLQAPLAEGGHTVTLEDLLAGAGDNPADLAAVREYDRLAAQHAADILPTLTPRERITLLARALRLSFAHPAVERLAGCGKSQLSDCFRRLALRTFDHMHREYRGESRQQVVRLAVMTLQSISERLLDQERSEKQHSRLFSLAEGPHEPGGNRSKEPESRSQNEQIAQTAAR